MRHSRPTSSSRTSTKRRIPTIRGRRPHRLVHRRQRSRTRGQRAVHRPERRGIYVQRLGRAPSRSSFRRKNPEKVAETRERKNFLKKAKKETSHQDYPKKSSKKPTIRELDRILDQLSSEIEELIREYKKDQLPGVLSRNIRSEKDTRGTPPAQHESNK